MTSALVDTAKVLRPVGILAVNFVMTLQQCVEMSCIKDC